MSKKDNPNTTERIVNEDGSQLKVIASTNEDGSKAIIVHEKDAKGNPTGQHVTDPFDKSQVHVHDDNGDRFEGGGLSSDSGGSDNTDDSNDDNDSGGCFITSAVCTNFKKSDDCVELTMFRHFRDTFMQETTEMQKEVKEYYNIAPKICNAIDSLGEQLALEEYARIWKDSLESAFTALNVNNKREAYNIYKKMVLCLKEHYLKETQSN